MILADLMEETKAEVGAINASLLAAIDACKKGHGKKPDEKGKKKPSRNIPGWVVYLPGGSPDMGGIANPFHPGPPIGEG